MTRYCSQGEFWAKNRWPGNFWYSRDEVVFRWQRSLGVYFRRMPIFLSGGFFSRVGGGGLSRNSPKMGASMGQKWGKITIYALVMATKKATGQKNWHSAEMRPPALQLTKISKISTIPNFSRSTRNSPWLLLRRWAALKRHFYEFVYFSIISIVQEATSFTQCDQVHLDAIYYRCAM